MKFTVTGTNHRFSPLEIRERLSFSKKKKLETSRFLETVSGIQSFFILSTCNRSEIYLWGDPDRDIRGIFCGLHGISQETLTSFLYHYEGEQTLRHLLRVMCGLDSQILGESQIFEQVQQAVCRAEGSGGLDLQAVFCVSRAIAIAEKIRRRTDKGHFSETLADAAFGLIRRNRPSFHDEKFILVGTGKVMELFISLLAREGIRPVIVSNRNHDKAVEWARVLGGSAGRLEELPVLVPDSGVIISATSCPTTVLHREYFQGPLKSVLVLDLAVPRDVDASIKEVPGVRLFDLDDLGLTGVKNGLEDWAESAEQRVQKECEVLWKELSGSGQEKVLLR